MHLLVLTFLCGYVTAYTQLDQNMIAVVPYDNTVIFMSPNGGNRTRPTYTYTPTIDLTDACIYDHRGTYLGCDTFPTPQLNQSEWWYIVPNDYYFVWPPRYIGHTITTPSNMTLTTLSVTPTIFDITGVISPEEADAIMAFGSSSHLTDSLVYGENENVKSSIRTSKQVWVDYDTHPGITNIITRITDITHIPFSSVYENVQLARYDTQGFYRAHHDWFPHKTDPFRNRFLTFMIYLNTPEQGGSTCFPLFNATTVPDDVYNRCDIGLNIPARKTHSVLFYQYLPGKQFTDDYDTTNLHHGCDVIKGEKWILNQWIYNF